jgi:hypothetical protein
VLLMRVGGHGGTGAVGIHGRHLDDAERIRYVASDERRQQIARVTWIDDDGKPVEFVREGVAPPPGSEERRMDCVDCHNRPTHAFELPARAIDKAFDEGRIARDLPWLKKTALAALAVEYPSRDAARAAIPEAITAFYRREHPELLASRARDVEAAGLAVRDAWLRNVFPAMRVGWGAHPNNIGHQDFPGCFRCHDDQMKSRDGRVISQDCEACHAILAMEEPNPKLLSDIGLKP